MKLFLKILACLAALISVTYCLLRWLSPQRLTVALEKMDRRARELGEEKEAAEADAQYAAETSASEEDTSADA